jgi:hypothetical protein
MKHNNMKQTKYQYKVMVGNKVSNLVLPLPIAGFEHYVVSKDGRVFNTLDTHYNIADTPKEIKGHVNSVTGYVQVTLQNKPKGIKAKTLYVHRLVAEAYLEKPTENHVEVNHKNLIKSDNRLENLEWMTRDDNRKHMANLKGKYGLNYELSINDRLLRAGIKVYGITESIHDVAELWDCSIETVRRILKANNVVLAGKVVLPSLLKEQMKIDIKLEMANNKRIGSKILFRREFLKFLTDKYQMEFSRHYLDKLKNEVLKGI